MADRSVLISIQPYWVFLIIAKEMGWKVDQEKTVEVRKNYPKDEKWDKFAKIYCSKDRKSFAKIPKEYQPLMEHFLGKVIGSLVCNEIKEITADNLVAIYFNNPSENTCLNDLEMREYANGNNLFLWHISDLVIYDKPKELREFCTVDNKAIQQCEHREIVGQPEYKTAHNGWIKGSYICNKGEPDWCTKCKTKPITRPPQSWCYVEREVDTDGRIV